MTRTRTGITVGLAVAALGGTFLLGTQVSDDGDGRARPDRTEAQRLTAGTPLGSSDLALVAAGDCDDLLGWYVENTRDLVTAYGWGGGITYAYDGGWAAEEGGRMPLADNQQRTSADFGKTLTDLGSSETGTNVQEMGVDEPDVVKTDGEILVRLVEDDLVVFDVSGKKPERLASVDLPGKGQQQPEMLLVGDRAVVLSQEWSNEAPRTVVRTVSLADPAEPEVLTTSTYAAELVSARQYDTTVRLVLSNGLPMLDFVMPGDDRTERQALKQNLAILEESAITDWLPTVTDDSGDGGDAVQAVDCADMARPGDFDGGGNLLVVGHDAATPTERTSTGVASSAMTVYSSTDRLYLASSAWGGCCWGDMVLRSEGPWGGSGRIAPDFQDDGTTTLHAFELDGTATTYLASGEVEGSIRDRWAMDSVDGVLRVAVGPTSETGDFNSVVTLEEDDGTLAEIGRVDRLGVGEEIKAVRWFDDVAYVVTFRQTDPLYAIDLAKPSAPRLLGELKIPGFSSYLHPIGDDRLLGIGMDADLRGNTGAEQASTFDISDPAHPVRLGTFTFHRNKVEMVSEDPRRFTWLPEQDVALLVTGRYGRAGGMTGFIAVLTVADDGSITRELRRGTYGYDDVASLRTVPLPDGRVVVVTEDSARFLEL